MTARRYVLALDQGTTGSTALVVDPACRVLARGYAELPQYFPRPGWVEHAPEEIWTTVERAARAALGEARIAGAEVAAIGITNQRETTILWDRASGAPLYRAIVWQCRRTAPICERLRAEGAEPLVRERTGLVLDAYFSGTKIGWVLDEVPGARSRAERGHVAFGTVDAWLLWKLTGGRVHATDASNASRTLCLSLKTGDWDDEMLKLLGVPRAVLPAVLPSAGTLGETSDLGWLPRAVPVTGIAGDQQAALFGQACHAPGAAKNTYGTGCFMLLNTGTTPVASSRGLLTTIAWRIGGRTTYALEGSVFIAGAAIQWLRDGLGLFTHAAASEAMARSVDDTAGVYFVPAFVGLGAPYWDMYARGAIVGLTRGTAGARGDGRTSDPNEERTHATTPAPGASADAGARCGRGRGGPGAHRERAGADHSGVEVHPRRGAQGVRRLREGEVERHGEGERDPGGNARGDRKSTRLNSSH